jgi:phosphate transport system protein
MEGTGDAPVVRAFDRELAALEEQLAGMADAVVAVLAALTGAIGGRTSLATVVAADDPVDETYLRIEHEVVELIARRQPVARDLRRIVAVLQAALHLERIGDSGEEAAALLAQGAAPADEAGRDRWLAMVDLVAELTRAAHGALVAGDATAAWLVAERDLALDALQREAADALATAPVDGGDVRSRLLADRVGRVLERAGDHAVDIAEDAHFLVTGERREFRPGQTPGGAGGE